MLLVLLPLPDARADSVSDRIREIFAQGWALEGQMHVDLANLDRAITLYEEAISLAPDNEEARWRLAEVTFKKSEETRDKEERKKLVEKSISLADQALALDPDSVGGMYWGGVARARLADMSGLLAAMKQIGQAKDYLHQAIITDPEHRLSVLSGVILALIYSESPWPLNDMGKASELARWAVAKDPNLTIASLCLGKVYLAEGGKNSAEKELKRCLAIEHPTYLWDAVLYDWPEARTILAGISRQK